MNRQIRIAALLASLVIICALALPNLAYAQTNLTDMQTDVDTCNQNIVTNMQATAQKKIAVINSAYQNMTPLDASEFQCLQNISDALGKLDSATEFDSSISIKAVLAGAFNSAMTSVVMGLLKSNCSVLAADINNLTGGIVGQFNKLCIPLPKLKIGIGIPLIKFPNSACNGVDLLQPQFNKINHGVQTPGSWDLWGMVHKN